MRRSVIVLFASVWMVAVLVGISVAAAGGNAVSYTKLEDICRDGKKSIGKVAEIGGLFLADCFPETINFHTNQRCVTTVELKPSPAVYAKLKPYEFKNNLRVRFRITQTYIENNHIKGEFIAMTSGDGRNGGAGFIRATHVPAKTPTTTTAASGSMGWRYVGKGDCTGMDIGGLTMGSPAPDNVRCSPSFKGMTAVCWDGRSFKHYGSDQPQCTYKNISPNRCTGGGSPGHMYECVEMQGYAWVQVGKGDCTGRDVQPLSMGSPKPKPELCNAQFVNKTSVCWDGSSMKHWGSGQPQCTYKDIAPEACRGGGSPGYMYKCVYKTNASYSAVSEKPQQDQTPYRPPAQPSQGWQQPMAASSVAGETSWRYVGTGDCTGMDVGGLTVGSPMPDTGRCGSSSKGMTAVCWDGRSFKHYGSDKPQCTYKNVNAKNCRGGGSPGHMYECVETAGYVWIQVGQGDCTGRDVRPLSMGSPKPKPELCNAQFVNKTSVCWDGSSMKHWGSGQPQCTYKDVAPEACRGGGSPGYMYKCVYKSMGASSQSFPDAGVTAGESSFHQQGQPQQGFVERTFEEGVQIGVKKGVESLKGIFK